MPRSLPDALSTVPHRTDVPFSRLTTLGVGGICRWLFEPVSEAQAQGFVRACAREGMAFRILGGGSNLVVLGDIQVPVLRLDLPRELRREGLELTAPASHGHIALALAAAKAGLSGLEFASGIPGSVGGAVRMNAGAYGREWVDVLARYRFLTPAGDLIEKAPEPGEFEYRRSWLTGGQMILSATVRLAEGDPLRIQAQVSENREKRGTSQPLSSRNAGCIFKNPPGRSAGRLIDEAGLKGLKVGDAEVSPEHGNFLVNRGKASGEDFLELMERVRAAVLERHGVSLEAEVEIWREGSASGRGLPGIPC
ncbi:MAG: UDP-N-acetylmuramate dehydrogenase [Acidobacteria bacterium]|nr:UDP-N-acetylmuramate dehydrogenase [Acidobacteriota bacterium]